MRYGRRALSPAPAVDQGPPVLWLIHAQVADDVGDIGRDQGRTDLSGLKRVSLVDGPDAVRSRA
jgi:hypothetical protein